MKAKINWINRNTISHTVTLYRELTPFTSIDELTPFAQLEQGANEFIDETVEINKLYYYRVFVQNDYDSYLTDQLTVNTMLYNGPGPQTFEWGDYECGYFGSIASSDFLTADDLIMQLEITLSPYRFTVWNKFAFEGKILYFSNNYFINTSWDNLYNNGLIYGDAPEEKINLRGITTPVNQKRYVYYNGDKFLIRAPRTLPGNQSTIDLTKGNSSPTNTFSGSEIDALFHPMMGVFNAATPGPIYANVSFSTLLGNNNSTICQEATNNGQSICRLLNSTNPYGYGIGASSSTSFNIGGSSTTGGVYRPVLEFKVNEI